jgi:hypothetical protein
VKSTADGDPIGGLAAAGKLVGGLFISTIREALS